MFASPARTKCPLPEAERVRVAAAACAIDGALSRFPALDADQARIVELRFFAGLTVDETALVLDPRRGRSSVSGSWPRPGWAANSAALDMVGRRRRRDWPDGVHSNEWGGEC
jgi:hypothetical protein